MAPLDRFEAELAKLQGNQCKVDSIVQKVKQDYNSQAEQADNCLDKKQVQAMKKHGLL